MNKLKGVYKMSWYSEKLNTLREQQENNTQSPFAKRASYNIESVVFMITNMLTDEDFEKVKAEFLKVDGVQEVKRHLTKKVEILYDNRKIGLEHLTIALRKTGYKYINRACRNCMKK